MQVPRGPRPRGDRLLQRHQQLPGLRQRPGHRRGGDLRAVPGQPGQQRVQAPPGRIPLAPCLRDERIGQKALADRLRRPRRHHRGRHRAPARPPVPAPPVHQHPDDHLPVQLPDHVIAEHRERPPAPRTAIRPVLEIPGHLGPGQMRVIPPAVPRPAPLPRHAGRTVAPRAARPAIPLAGGGLTALLRGPAEHHPLQHRQLSGHLLKLSAALRQALTQPGILPGQLRDQHGQPLVRRQRIRQRIPQLRDRIGLRNHPGNRHRPQQTPSGTRNHASRPGVSRPRHPRAKQTPNHKTSD